MPYTDEFRNILRNTKRKVEIDIAFEKATEEANNLGIDIYRERKKRESLFKRQPSTFAFDFI